MAITIKLPYFPGETGVTADGYSESGTLLQSGIALTESTQPGMYTGSLSFSTFPVGYYTILIYSDGETEAFGSWDVAITADNTTADYAESIGALKARAAVGDIEFSPIIAPVIGYADTRVRQSTIPLYVGDTADRSITLIDSITLEPVDIEDINLQLVVETARKGDVKTYADNELTKSGNTVVFTPTNAMVASERTLNFALKPTVTGHPLAWGIMPVTYVPRSGSS